MNPLYLIVTTILALLIQPASGQGQNIRDSLGTQQKSLDSLPGMPLVRGLKNIRGTVSALAGGARNLSRGDSGKLGPALLDTPQAGHPRDSVQKAPGAGIYSLKNLSRDSVFQKAAGRLRDTTFKKQDFSASSILLRQVRALKNNIPDAGSLLKGAMPARGKKGVAPLVALTQAELSDNFSTTPINYSDSSITAVQNTLQGNFSFALAGKYAFSGYALYRRTLSGPLPDFFDFHIGYTGAVPQAGRLPSAGLPGRFQGHNIFDSAIGQLEARVAALREYPVGDKVLAAREVMGNFRADSSYRFTDSATVAGAKELLAWYDGYERAVAGLERQADSLRRARDRFAAVIGHGTGINDIISAYATGAAGNLKSSVSDSLDALRETRAAKVPGGRLTRLGLGRVFPYQSELTMKNNSLRGADLRYERGRYILSASAGLIDYRLNGLLRKKPVERPLPYAVVLYAGYRVLPHITAGVRYFNGRKDNYAAGVTRATLSGAALELAYGGGGKTFSAELAKNSSQPSFTGGSTAGKSFWDIGDRENMAVSFRSSVYLRGTRTSIDASYTAQGKYYNAFNSYSSNTQTKKYDIKVSQNLWRGLVRLSGWVRNTEYTPALNGILLQNEVSLKSFNASLRKTGWPLVTLGYNPVRQTFISDSSVQLSVYQALSVFSAYSYRLGIRPATVSLAFNRLGGRQAGGTGAGGYLGNSANILFDHRVDFQGYSSLLNLSYIGSRDFLLVTAGSGLVVRLRGKASLRAGVTVSSFNHTGGKAGGNLGFQAALGGRGTVGVDYTLSYLPSVSGSTLMRYNYGNATLRYSLVR